MSYVGVTFWYGVSLSLWNVAWSNFCCCLFSKLTFQSWIETTRFSFTNMKPYPFSCASFSFAQWVKVSFLGAWKTFLPHFWARKKYFASFLSMKKQWQMTTVKKQLTNDHSKQTADKWPPHKQTADNDPPLKQIWLLTEETVCSRDPTNQLTNGLDKQTADKWPR